MEQSFCGVRLNQYLFIRVIGQGVSSSVYYAVDQSRNVPVAIKVLPKEQVFCHPKYVKLMRTEISVLKSCQNENVIHFLDCFESSTHIFIATEFCNGGDLDQYLIMKRRLKEQVAVRFLKQILNGFKGLHEVGAMHRDFKAANVLIHNENTCKIADLGFAKIMEEDDLTKSIIGTTLTMAPEILSRKSYGFKADIWSVGVVFYQMLFGKYPFKGKSDGDLLYNIHEKPLKFKQSVVISDDAKDFLHRCLTADPLRRISWKDIHSHPLVNGRRKVAPIKLVSISSLSSTQQFYNDCSLSKEFNGDTIPVLKTKDLNSSFNRVKQEPSSPATSAETPDYSQKSKQNKSSSSAVSYLVKFPMSQPNNYVSEDNIYIGNCKGFV